MARHTKYHNLSDDELLHQVDVARQSSDVIEELAARMEKGAAITAATGLECPCCEAKLNVKDDGDGPELEVA